jgi:hypothetical protein
MRCQLVNKSRAGKVKAAWFHSERESNAEGRGVKVSCCLLQTGERLDLVGRFPQVGQRATPIAGSRGLHISIYINKS